MSWIIKNTAAFILVAVLILPSFTGVIGPSLPQVQTDLSSGADSAEVVFSGQGTRVVNIPVYSNATYDHCTIGIEGSESQNRYPSNVAVDIGGDGTVEWEFDDELGRITQLESGADNYRFDFTEVVKYNDEESFVIPAKALVTGATFNMTPKGGFAELLFVNINEIDMMAAVDDEMWMAGKGEWLIKRHVITDSTEVFTNIDGLNNTNTTALAADEDFVYVGSETMGVSIYDRKKEQFSSHRWDTDNRLDSNNIKHLDSNGEWVFITTDVALYVFKKFGDFGDFLYKWEVGDELESLEVVDIETWGSKVFIGTPRGVSVYDSDSTDWIQLDRNNGLRSNFVEDMVVDDEILYIATDQGISRYIHSTDEFDTFIDNAQLPDSWVFGLAQNSTSIFAHSRSGSYDSVTRIDKSTGMAVGESWHKGNRDIGSDEFNEILFFNKQMYIATSIGVFMGVFPYEIFSQMPLSNNQIAGNSVRDVTYDPNDKIVNIATDQGMSRFDIERSMYLEPWDQTMGLVNDNVNTIITTSSHIYVGTNYQGVARWSKELEDWETPLDRYTADVALKSNKISNLAFGNDILYIGHDKGVDRFKVSDDMIIDTVDDPRWDYMTFNATRNEGVIVNDIVSDDEYIYIALSPVFDHRDEILSEGGLWAYNTTNSSWLLFNNNSEIGGNLSTNDIRSLAQNETKLFIGTSDGLNIMNKSTFNVTIINNTIEPTFPGGAVKEICLSNPIQPTLYMVLEPVMNHTLGYTVGGGLIKFDVNSHNVSDIFNRSTTELRMTSNQINDIEKIGNILYISTETGGLERLDLQQLEIMDMSQSMGDLQYSQGVNVDIANDGEIEVSIPLFKLPVKLDMTEEINRLLHYSTDIFTSAEGVELSRIPINISINPDSVGVIVISDIEIEYEYEYILGDFSRAVNTYRETLPFEDGNNLYDMPVLIFSASSGAVSLKDLVMAYHFVNPPVIVVTSPVSPGEGGDYRDSVPIEFDARDTYDRDGDQLDFLWTSDNDTSFRGTSKHFLSTIAEGWHNITLNVSEPTGEHYLAYIIIFVRGNEAPNARIAYPRHNEAFFKGDVVEFSALGSSDPDSDLMTYTWSSSRGDPDDEEIKWGNREVIGKGKKITYIFTNSGIYNISLDVGDGSLSDRTYIDLLVEFSNKDQRSWTWDKTTAPPDIVPTMFDVIVDYTVVHSSYTASDMSMRTFDIRTLPAPIPTNRTHIGICFNLTEETNGTVYGESLNISYRGQNAFLDNVDPDTMGLYRFNGTRKKGDRWEPCPTMVHDIEEMYISSSIPQEGRKRSKATEFVLFANISGWNDEPLTISTTPARDADKVDPVDVVITVTFSNNIIFENLDVSLLDEEGLRKDFLFDPHYDNETNVSFRVENLDYNSKYTIRVDYVMDEYRQVEENFVVKFHTMNEPAGPPPDLPWFWIILGIVVLLAIGGAVYFFVFRKGGEVEIEEAEILSCPRCGVVIEGEDVADCPECGFELEKKSETVLAIDFINCPGCNAKIDSRSKVCPFCSKPIGEEEEEEKVEEAEEEEEEVEEVEIGEEGVPFDVECPTCGSTVEQGMTECPACGEMEFSI